ncbi:hypothetical protein TNCV_2953701 [Trichonephila clavipes]|nr:hypothetical protein TNCV_2953701 [Trichonephila clavipes]
MKPSNCDVDLPSLDTGENDGLTGGRSHSPGCTTAHDDRRIVHMTVMDRAATSRTVAHHSLLRIIRGLLVPFDAVCRGVECPQDVHCFVYI